MTSGITPKPLNPELPIEGSKKPKDVLRDSTNRLSGTITPIKNPLSAAREKDPTTEVAKKLVPLVKSPRSLNLRSFQNDEHRHAAIKTILESIKDKGVTEVGIFRVSGNKDEVASLVKTLTINPSEAAELLAKADIHVAVGALKEIAKNAAYETRQGQSLGRKLAEIGGSVKVDKIAQLPLTQAQRNILDSVIGYAVKVAQAAETNKMDPKNLAIVMAPWFGPESTNMADMASIKAHNEKVVAFFEAMINNKYKFSG